VRESACVRERARGGERVCESVCAYASLHSVRESASVYARERQCV